MWSMWKFVFTVDDSRLVFTAEDRQLDELGEEEKELNRVPLRMADLT